MLAPALFLLLGAAVSSDFPPVPDDFLIIDRALIRCSIPGEEHTLYIILHNREGTGSIEIFSGVRLQPGWEWESVCLWQPENPDGSPVVFQPFTILSVRQENSSVMISWIDGLDPGDDAPASLVYDLRHQDFEVFSTD